MKIKARSQASCQQIKFFDAKRRFALLTLFSYVNDEPKRSEAKKETRDKNAKRSFISRLFSFDAKLRFARLSSFSFFALAQHFRTWCQHDNIRRKSPWIEGFFVNKRKQVHRLHRNQVEYILVVDEGNLVPFDPFSRVLFLFKLEDMMDKELLQLLVREVDA